MDIIKFLHLPEVASAHGHEIDMMIYLTHLLMLVLFIGWGIFFLITLLRFNKWAHPKANYKGVQSHISSSLEVTIAIIETVLLIGFSIPFWAKQVNAFPTRDDVVNVRIIAEQFAWNVHYPGEDGIFGNTAIEFFDKQSNAIGLDPSDEYGKDDIITINQLHLPIGRPAVIRLSSKDVVHCFGLNEMRVKQDIIPGMSIPVWFTPTKTGNFEINCAQLCGLGHYRMKGFLTIHNKEGFDDWISNQATASGGDAEYDDFWN